MHFFLVNREDGQSIIEFIISFTLSIPFLYLFLKIALNYTEGYLIHYANFMASRAYKVYENSSNQELGFQGGAENHARDLVNTIFPLQRVSGDFSVSHPTTGSPHFNVFVGTVVQYQTQFSIPLVIGTNRTLNMISESYLGRTPSRARCLRRICDSMTPLGVGQCSNREASIMTLSDNGC